MAVLINCTGYPTQTGTVYW